MKKHFLKFSILFLIISACSQSGNNTGYVGEDPVIANGCDGINYPNWETSKYVLPYPVGQSYTIGLSNCSGYPHGENDPDRFAIDFNMDVGTLVTASRKGTIMFVEDSGNNYEEVNNMVVLRDEDGLFLQYQHLTKDGALVKVGDFVDKGDPIGLSGASGMAGYPHLHFVATGFNDWMFPYSMSYPVTFSNTKANPKSLIQAETYTALPY